MAVKRVEDNEKNLQMLEGKRIIKAYVEENLRDDVVVIRTPEGDLRLEAGKMDDDVCDMSVKLEDIDGDLDRLIGQEVIKAEERTISRDLGNCGNEMDSFYSIRTPKDSVVMRFYGESNGFYAVDVYCIWIDKKSMAD